MSCRKPLEVSRASQPTVVICFHHSSLTACQNKSTSLQNVEHRKMFTKKYHRNDTETAKTIKLTQEWSHLLKNGRYYVDGCLYKPDS